MKKEDLSFLEKKALALGALEAKIIPASDVVVEDRVVLKCKTGCDDYGSKLCCPPYAPSVDEFRKMLNDYRYALFLKFESGIKADDDVTHNLMRHVYDPEITGAKKANAQKFYAEWSEEAKKILMAVLELEKAAFNGGYPFAVAFTAGSCVLCSKCNMETRICTRPTVMRFPEHAVGINMLKTAENAGSPIKFPVRGKLEPTGLVLID